ncbi:ABC-three component system protein [Maricaulis sp.]|uniref:ABC-three component system protein n=1 Tax=Maricaulis sp. TaxID=1486257 RepID=UPI003A919A55
MSARENAGGEGLLCSIPSPTPWPNANSRLLGFGQGLPVEPLVRLAQFGATEFERFTLEWASGYLARKLPEVDQVQQRGGAGDKGRDIVVWLDPPSTKDRRWHLYQCKHYDVKLGAGVAATELGKVMYYSFIGDYILPDEYWFVTHKGVSTSLQDLIDQPDDLIKFLFENWSKYCSKKIIANTTIELTNDLKCHIESYNFSKIRAKQPLELIDEHAQTPYHLRVFGLPLIERPRAEKPPSEVTPIESIYVEQLYQVASERLGQPIVSSDQFSHDQYLRELFERSRMTFYCAEGLKRLARDHMADSEFFEHLLDEFSDGLYHHYSDEHGTGLSRLISTVKAAQCLELEASLLTQVVQANDREGMCHQLANEHRVQWCKR